MNIYNPELLQVPFYYGLFARPSPVTVEALTKIRVRNGIPLLLAGVERHPGVWGLRTPGYYIVAFHFRAMPLGFEPMAKVTHNLAFFEVAYV